MAAMTNGPMEFGAAMLTLPGETESGDRYVVKHRTSGVLVAVVDGLGHGSEAAAAAKVALSVLETYVDEPVITLLNRCHESLRRTRGVVMSLASFDFPHDEMTWLGVGNVEGLLLRGDKVPPVEHLILRPGVAGSQLPPLRATVVPLQQNDTLIFFTDGIRSDFTEKTLDLGLPVQVIADRILARHTKGTDDALVLVGRYRKGL